MRVLKQNTTRNINVFMTSSLDHIAGVTGASLSMSISKDGGTFSVVTPSITNLSSGWYAVVLSGSYLDTLGDLAIHIGGPNCDPTDLVCQVVAYDMGAATNLGLSYLDQAASAYNTRTLASGLYSTFNPLTQYVLVSGYFTNQSPTDALTNFPVPTVTQMNARTLPSGEYFNILSDLVMLKLADVIMRRPGSGVFASPYGDPLGVNSLYGVLQHTQDSYVSGANLYVRNTDNSALATLPIATGAGNPITGIGTG